MIIIFIAFWSLLSPHKEPQNIFTEILGKLDDDDGGDDDDAGNGDDDDADDDDGNRKVWRYMGVSVCPTLR